MQIKSEIEHHIIEANEIAASIVRDIVFELQFAGAVLVYGFCGKKRTYIDELLKPRKNNQKLKSKTLMKIKFTYGNLTGFVRV